MSPASTIGRFYCHPATLLAHMTCLEPACTAACSINDQETRRRSSVMRIESRVLRRHSLFILRGLGTHAAIRPTDLVNCRYKARSSQDFSTPQMFLQIRPLEKPSHAAKVVTSVDLS